MLEIWESMKPPLLPADLVKVAVGPKELPNATFNPWQTLVAEIVVGDAFGVDRMDYLLVARNHFRVLYQRNPADLKVNPGAGEAVYRAAVEKFGADHVERDTYPQKGGAYDFPVLLHDWSIVSSTSLSKVLAEVPIITIDTVFVAQELMAEAEAWLKQNKDEIIRPREEEE